MRFQMAGLPNFRAHSKSVPLANPPLFAIQNPDESRFQIPTSTVLIGFLNVLLNIKFFAGILMFRIVKDPFVMAFSKTAKKKYWFNTHNGDALFECPKNAVMDFKNTFAKK